MCDLCSTDPGTRANALDQQKYFANDLREFAADIDQLTYGHIKPHSTETGNMVKLAHRLIRELVEEWL